MQYLLLIHGKNGYADAPKCYVYTYIASLVYCNHIHAINV
jgi:hypothetical protein